MNKRKPRHHLPHNNASLVLCLTPLPSSSFLWQPPPGWTGDSSNCFHTTSTFLLIAVITLHCTSWLSVFLPKPSLRGWEPYRLVHSSLKHKRQLLKTQWLDGWTNTWEFLEGSVMRGGLRVRQIGLTPARCFRLHQSSSRTPCRGSRALSDLAAACLSSLLRYHPLPCSQGSSLTGLFPGPQKPRPCLPAQLFLWHLPGRLSVIPSISAHMSPTLRHPS